MIPDLNENVDDPFNLESLIERIGLKIKNNKRKKGEDNWVPIQKDGPHQKKKKRDDADTMDSKVLETYTDWEESVRNDIVDESNKSCPLAKEQEHERHLKVRVDTEDRSEADETIRVAECLGINLNEFHDQVLNLVSGEKLNKDQ